MQSRWQNGLRLWNQNSVPAAKLSPAKPPTPTARPAGRISGAKHRKLVWQKPLVHVAADIGVSDVALKKHCVKQGIELPPRGYWLREPSDRRR